MAGDDDREDTLFDVAVVRAVLPGRALRQHLPQQGRSGADRKACMIKDLVRAPPLAHARVFFKNIAHLARLVSPQSGAAHQS